MTRKRPGVAAVVSLILLSIFAPLLPAGVLHAAEGCPELLSPPDGATDMPVSGVSFSWAPQPQATKYEFVLAEDPAMNMVVEKATVSGTSYRLQGVLKYDTAYFWHVRALEPVPGDWSPVSAFFTTLLPSAAPQALTQAPPVWSAMFTPDTTLRTICSPSEVNRIAVAPDGKTVWALDVPVKKIWRSTTNGALWGSAPNWCLHHYMSQLGIPTDNQTIWDIAVAPDDGNFIAVVTGSVGSRYPTDVWISYDGGALWQWSILSALLAPGEYVRCIDISVKYGSGRDIAVGTADGSGNGDVYILRSVGFQGWVKQGFDAEPLGPLGDFHAVRFSPRTYANGGLALVFADQEATYYNISLVDRLQSRHLTFLFCAHVEVRDSALPPGASPEATTLVSADLELPSDFNEFDTGLRRAYLSIDDGGSGSAAGIFRIDGGTVFTLMDTSATPFKRISSIAYFGTCESGELLAGEVLGNPCRAEVWTWFTDAPTECPIPCWYPSLNSATGAAGQTDCSGAFGEFGFGNAQVAWLPDGKMAYCGTGSADFRYGGVDTTPGSGRWPAALLTGVGLDESALSLTRNRGETWNQTGLIDTRIDKLTDVAPSPDSSTIYLASVNRSQGCAGFDSVWRSSINPQVAAPLPVLTEPGIIWERVLCRPTGETCVGEQTDMALLRLPPDREDGMIVMWAAQDSQMLLDRGVMMWSPDYGDYWAVVTPRRPVQDFALESSTMLYVLSPIGLVQKMPYTGVAWATTLPDVDTGLDSASAIAAFAGGCVIVSGGKSSLFPAAYSTNGAQSFSPILTPLNMDTAVPAFSPHFSSDNIFYLATNKSGTAGSVYCNTVPGSGGWTDLKPPGTGYTGLALGQREALYAARQRAVDRAVFPHMGIPGNDGRWEVLDLNLLPTVSFTLGPNSLKLSKLGSSANVLYAIDDDDYVPADNRGKLWKCIDYPPQSPSNFPALLGDYAVRGSVKFYDWRCNSIVTVSGGVLHITSQYGPKVEGYWEMPADAGIEGWPQAWQAKGYVGPLEYGSGGRVSNTPRLSLMLEGGEYCTYGEGGSYATLVLNARVKVDRATGKVKMLKGYLSGWGEYGLGDKDDKGAPGEGQFEGRFTATPLDGATITGASVTVTPLSEAEVGLPEAVEVEVPDIIGDYPTKCSIKFYDWKGNRDVPVISGILHITWQGSGNPHKISGYWEPEPAVAGWPSSLVLVKGYVGPLVRVDGRVQNTPRLSLVIGRGTYPFTGSYVTYVLNGKIKWDRKQNTVKSIKGTIYGWGEWGDALEDGSAKMGQFEGKFTAQPE